MLFHPLLLVLIYGSNVLLEENTYRKVMAILGLLLVSSFISVVNYFVTDLSNQDSKFFKLKPC